MKSTRKPKFRHKTVTQMEACLFLDDSSKTYSSCTSALTSHLHFPLNPHPSRTQTAEESQQTLPHAPLFFPQPPADSHPNSIPNRDLDKENPSDPRSNTDQPPNLNLDRQETKIFGKIRAFENRMASSEKPGGSAGGRVASPDSSDGGKPGGPSREEARILQGAAQKRATFKQRASSLEDKTYYSQRVQSYQNKFTEELQRIKKLVGKPSLKKAFSSEQLSQKDRLAAETVEPIPPQVVQKLEARERAMRAREAGERGGKSQVKGRNPDAQTDLTVRSSQGSTARCPVATETAPIHHFPGQPLPTATRTSLSRFVEDYFNYVFVPFRLS